MPNTLILIFLIFPAVQRGESVNSCSIPYIRFPLRFKLYINTAPIPLTLTNIHFPLRFKLYPSAKISVQASHGTDTTEELLFENALADRKIN